MLMSSFFQLKDVLPVFYAIIQIFFPRFDLISF